MAKVPNITIHGIRHTVATLAIGARQDIRTLADLPGHSKTSVTTDIYAHVLSHRRRELTQAISQIVLGNEETADKCGLFADGCGQRRRCPDEYSVLTAEYRIRPGDLGNRAVWFWQGRQDSNPRPSVLETDALTGLSYAPAKICHALA